MSRTSPNKSERSCSEGSEFAHLPRDQRGHTGEYREECREMEYRSEGTEGMVA